MKKLLLLLTLAVLSSVAFSDIGPVGRSAQDDATGTLQAGSLEKWYIYVKNTSGSTASDGMLFVAETTEDDGYSVTTGTTAGSFPVCVLAKEDGGSCADDEVCRCQTYGLNSGVVFDVTNGDATAGQQAFVSENTAGYVQAEALGSIAASDIPIGVFLDSYSTTSADAEIFLRLR